jgi:hypothetical protein
MSSADPSQLNMSTSNQENLQKNGSWLQLAVAQWLAPQQAAGLGMLLGAMLAASSCADIKHRELETTPTET